MDQDTNPNALSDRIYFDPRLKFLSDCRRSLKILKITIGDHFCHDEVDRVVALIHAKAAAYGLADFSARARHLQEACRERLDESVVYSRIWILADLVEKAHGGPQPECPDLNADPHAVERYYLSLDDWDS